MPFGDGKMAFMNTTVEMDKAGRVVLPKKVRDALHLRAGQRLTLEYTEDTISLSTERPGRGLYRKNGWLVWDPGVPVDAEMVEKLIEEDRAGRRHLLTGDDEG
jgi:AbrB family looped-hinge helix DNA binding protein